MHGPFHVNIANGKRQAKHRILNICSIKERCEKTSIQRLGPAALIRRVSNLTCVRGDDLNLLHPGNHKSYTFRCINLTL